MMGGCEVFCAFFCSVFCCALSVTYIVYLGIFAFDNPDRQAYYVIES